MNWIVRLLGIFLAFLWISQASPLNAQISHSEDDKKMIAKDAFDNGQIQYNLGRFDNALKLFSTAYENMPHGAFLFNIAQCHRQLKNHSKAIFFYEGYLRETPDAPNKEEVTVFLKEHKESLKIQDAPTPAYLDKSILAEDDDTEMDLLLKDARPQMVANLNQESTAPPVQAVPSDESVVQKDESSPAVSETEEVYETVVEVVDRPTATAIFDPKAFFKADNPWLWGAVGGIVLTGAAVTGILLSGNIEGLGNETPSTEPPSPSEDPPEEGSLGDLDFRGNP